MLIAQITDTHLGFDPETPNEFNRQRLDAVVDSLLAMERHPDLLLATDAEYAAMLSAYDSVTPGEYDDE